MKDEVKKMLLNINRPGMDKLVEYMEEKGFFISPASTKYHLACEGGVLIHSYSVYKLFKKMCEEFKINFSVESMIICAFGHDLCKAGQYVGDGKPYGWNKYNGNGHAKLSIERLEKFIKLTDDEKIIIKYHMGMYGTNEFSSRSGEYDIVELSSIYNINKIAKLFYFCDDMSTQFLENEDVHQT